MQTADFAALAERVLATPVNTLAQLTAWPWVVELVYLKPDGTHERNIVVAESPLAQHPDSDALVPDDCELLRSVAIPGSRFNDMAGHVRQSHKAHYRALLFWKLAKARGVSVKDLQASNDYDPIALDEGVERWAKPGCRFAGD